MISLIRSYELEVAHRLTAGVPENHKCRRLHGHRYELELEIEGNLDVDGMLIEYADLDRVVKPILGLVDHHDLNTLQQRCSTAEALSVAANPTVERLALWLVKRLAFVGSSRQEQGMRLVEVRLREDSRSAVVARPRERAEGMKGGV